VGVKGAGDEVALVSGEFDSDEARIDATGLHLVSPLLDGASPRLSRFREIPTRRGAFHHGPTGVLYAIVPETQKRPCR
jgi:hypothetical protein